MKEEENKNGVFLKLGLLIGVYFWYEEVFFFVWMCWFGSVILFNRDIS